jgi:superoxide reductase
MADIKNRLEGAEIKEERHIPFIDIPQRIKKNEDFTVKVTVGKDTLHPHTKDHYIRWIEVFFQTRDEIAPNEIRKFEFTPQEGEPTPPEENNTSKSREITLSLKTEKAGTIFATTYCNIHGLWQNSKHIEIE